MISTQREALEKIKKLVDMYVKGILLIFPDGLDGMPSRWVTVDDLTRVYRIRRSTITELINQGHLDARHSGGGWGLEVKVNQEEESSLRCQVCGAEANPAPWGWICCANSGHKLKEGKLFGDDRK